MKHCAHCFQENPDNSNFCMQCGHPLTDGPAEQAAELLAAVDESPAPAAETTAQEDPAETVTETTAQEDPAETVTETITQEGTSAPAVKEDTVIVAAVPAAIEIPLSVPDGSVVSAAVAIAEEPPPSPTLTPREEIRRCEEKIGVLRKIGAFFLCVLLFLFLLIPMAAYHVRDASTKEWISVFLEKVSVSDLGSLEGIEDAIGDWLRELSPQLEYVELDLSEGRSDIERFIDRVYVREFIARQLASYLDDLYSGASGAAFLAGDISELIAENNEIINEQLKEMVDDLFGSLSEIELRLTRTDRNDLAKRLIALMEDAGVGGYLDTAILRTEMPAIYYGLRFGFSYITVGVSLFLAALIFICLLKTLKSGLRATNRAGIVLIVLGGVLTPLALFPKLFADLWLHFFQDVRILALFAEEFFYTHILADLIVLAVGILMTVITGLALSIRKKRTLQ